MRNDPSIVVPHLPHAKLLDLKRLVHWQRKAARLPRLALNRMPRESIEDEARWHCDPYAYQPMVYGS